MGSRTVAMRAAQAEEEMSATHKRVSELEVQVGVGLKAHGQVCTHSCLMRVVCVCK